MPDELSINARIERIGEVNYSLGVLSMLRNLSEPTELTLSDENFGKKFDLAEKKTRKDRPAWVQGILSHFRVLKQLGIVFPDDIQREAEKLEEIIIQARRRLNDGEELSLEERQEQTRRGDMLIDRILEIANQQIKS